MTTRIVTGPSLDFDRFWRWLKNHPNCILEAGTPDCMMHDHDSLHWHLTEDEERNPVVQLILGKMLVGEMVLDVHDALFVQSTLAEASAEDTEDEEPGHCLFEVMTGSSDEPVSRYHFVLAHGYDEEMIHHIRMAQ
ncbi:MAG: hypothetical protein AB2A00_06025 [Myxococcota bacterium]